MPKHTLASVANLLRRSRLLTPEALRGLDDLRGQHATPGSLLRAVMKRSWVTPYQAVELFSGRREIVIVHGDAEYRLRITRANKLILTK